MKSADRFSPSVRTLVLVAAAFVVTLAAADDVKGPIVLEKFGSFFVGGKDVAVPYRSGRFISPTYEQPDVLKVDQMYVQYMIPMQRRHRYPVVLAHGAWHTGKTWEETPDGREGWVNYFARQGFSTYWVDKTWRARSAFNAQTINAVARGDADVSTLPNIYVTGRQGWAAFRFGPSFGVANPGVQFPLEAVDEYFKQLVPDFSEWLRGSPVAQTYPAMTAAAEALLTKIGPAVYIGHSQGGAEIPVIVRDRPDPALFAGVISVEGGACPPVEDAPLYKEIPFLYVTGDFTDPPTNCAPFVDALNGLGGRGTSLHLPDIGIKGNDHMMMLDKNNEQVAQALIDWIVKEVEGRNAEH